MSARPDSFRTASTSGEVISPSNLGPGTVYRTFESSTWTSWMESQELTEWVRRFPRPFGIWCQRPLQLVGSIREPGGRGGHRTAHHARKRQQGQNVGEHDGQLIRDTQVVC